MPRSDFSEIAESEGFSSLNPAFSGAVLGGLALGW